MNTFLFLSVRSNTIFVPTYHRQGMKTTGNLKLFFFFLRRLQLSKKSRGWVKLERKGEEEGVQEGDGRGVRSVERLPLQQWLPAS